MKEIAEWSAKIWWEKINKSQPIKIFTSICVLLCLYLFYVVAWTPLSHWALKDYVTWLGQYFSQTAMMQFQSALLKLISFLLMRCRILLLSSWVQPSCCFFGKYPCFHVGYVEQKWWQIRRLHWWCFDQPHLNHSLLAVTNDINSFAFVLVYGYGWAIALVLLISVSMLLGLCV